MTSVNIIVNNDGFHLIDNWANLKDYSECEKSFAIHAAVRFEDKKLYDYFIKKYNLTDKQDQYNAYLKKAGENLNKLQDNPTPGMQKIIDRYFSDTAFGAEYLL